MAFGFEWGGVVKTGLDVGYVLRDALVFIGNLVFRANFYVELLV